MISWGNYEEYMIMHADGELQPAEEQELTAFINAHPELKSELALYNLTRLSPDDTLVYLDKNSLFRSESLKRTISFPQWKRYAIAAGVAALVFISLFTYRDSNKSAVETVKVENVKKTLPTQQNDTTVQNIQVPQQMVAAIPISLDNTAPAHNKHTAGKAHYPKSAKKQHATAVAINEEPTPKQEQINALALAGMKTIPANNTTGPLLTPVSIPVYEPIVSSGRTKRSLIDRLPIDESNKYQLKRITHLATNTYNGVAKAKEYLDGYELTLNIEDKKIRISL